MTETAERELLPCPFCGGEATFDSDDAGWHWVECKKCGAMTDSDHHGDYDCTLALASLWNRRAAQPVTQPHQSEVAESDMDEQAAYAKSREETLHTAVALWQGRAINAEAKLAGHFVGTNKMVADPVIEDYAIELFTTCGGSSPMADKLGRIDAILRRLLEGIPSSVSDQPDDWRRYATERAGQAAVVPAGMVIDAYAVLATERRYVDGAKVQRVRQINGPDLWSVRWQGNCLNKLGEWEWEPMPSSRDDDFMARCRFSTADEALAAATGAAQPATQGEKT